MLKVKYKKMFGVSISRFFYMIISTFICLPISLLLLDKDFKFALGMIFLFLCWKSWDLSTPQYEDFLNCPHCGENYNNIFDK